MDETREVTITLNTGEDIDAFIDEIKALGYTLSDLMPLSRYNVKFHMTLEQSDRLKADPRVRECLFGTIEQNNIKISNKAVGTNNFYARQGVYTASPGGGFSANSESNWALYDCTSNSNPFSNYSSAFQRNYTLDGTGVDVVIMDTGLQIDHPEFQNANGVSRVQKINWWTAAGQSGSPPWTQDPAQANMPTGFYTDLDGHGTNVCSIMAGKTYGWAKNANIYVWNANGDVGALDPTQYSALSLISAWHLLKPIQANGYRRPTIINMSFAYVFGDYMDITGVNYRGISQVTTFPNNTYGLLAYNGNGLPYRYAAFDSDIEAALADGLIIVAAAGNNSYKIDVPGGADYNNYATGNFTDYSATTWYYQQGASPGGTAGVICVGAIDFTYNAGLFEYPNTVVYWSSYSTSNATAKASFSCTGPRINVWAPGGMISGATCNSKTITPVPLNVSNYSNNVYPVTTYYNNSSYKQQKDSGTSQASPQVAGMLACVAQMRPWMTYQDAASWLNTFSVPKTANAATTGGYADLFSLQGATTNYLYFPYQTVNNAIVTGSGSFSGTF